MTDPSAITFRCASVRCYHGNEHKTPGGARHCEKGEAQQAYQLGHALFRLAAACESRSLAWTVQRSHATLPGRDGEFYIVTLFGIGDGAERGRTIPFTSASLAAVVEAAAGFVGGGK